MNDFPVYFLTQRYLTPDGSADEHGGLQRYVRELARLAASHGQLCTIIQRGSTDFEREISPGIRVIGIKSSDRARGDGIFNHQAHRLIPPGAPVVYCLVEITYPHLREKSLAIQHGLWWDGRFPAWKQLVIRKLNQRVLRKTRGIVCVDTNYINWCLSTFKEEDLIFQKCFYVPNFADFNQFAGRVCAGLRGNQGLPVVLCPRRCEEKRGVGLLFDACMRLWNSGERFRVIFCGRGGMQGRVRSMAEEAGFGHLVEITEVPFDQMAEMYAQADLVVVPTLRHEGTSLACVEALQMAKPVVTTYVGGLGNIVVPGFNGEMVPPLAGPMAEAIRRLLHDPQLRSAYAERAASVGESLDIRRWRQAVWELFQRRLGVGITETREAVLAS